MRLPLTRLVPVLLAAACAKPDLLTQEQFSGLHYLDGRWLGSGGNYPAFYEEYRVLDDSTIVQRNFPDSTFAAASDSSVIQLRAGEGTSGNPGAVTYRIARIAGDTVRFEPAVEGRGGFSWIRVSESQWRAVLDGSPEPTVYEMRRISQPPTP